MRKYKHGGDNMNKEVGNGNLKPFEKGKVSREKAVEAGKKGGKASAWKIQPILPPLVQFKLTPFIQSKLIPFVHLKLRPSNR